MALVTLFHEVVLFYHTSISLRRTIRIAPGLSKSFCSAQFAPRSGANCAEQNDLESPGTGPICAKKEQSSVFLYREYTRSREAAGWLDVLWHVPTIKLHRAILVASGERYSGPGLPQHTPYLGTPVVFPPRTTTGLFFSTNGKLCLT